MPVAVEVQRLEQQAGRRIARDLIDCLIRSGCWQNGKRGKIGGKELKKAYLGEYFLAMCFSTQESKYKKFQNFNF